MITRLNVASIYVLDKDEALDFYVNKLGLEKGNDVKQGDYRWLTVRVPGEPGTEISLEQPGPPLHDEATAEQLRELITKGALSGLVFTPTTPARLYETLQERGVTDFTQEPTDHFYGTDMGLRDPFGNAIRILQRKAAAGGDGLIRPPPKGDHDMPPRRPPRSADASTPTTSGPTKSGPRCRRALESASRRQASAPEEERAAGERRSARRSPRCRPTDRAMARADPRARHRGGAGLVPRTYYGMPAYAKDGKVICFFKPEVEVQGALLRRFGFQPDARLDDGDDVAGRLRGDEADRRPSRSRSPSS